MSYTIKWRLAGGGTEIPEIPTLEEAIETAADLMSMPHTTSEASCKITHVVGRKTKTSFYAYYQQAPHNPHIGYWVIQILAGMELT